MPNEAAKGQAPDDHGDAPTYPADLIAAMQAELAALADIETNYAGKRHRLEDWAGSQKMKERIVREVEVRHKREREPHVLRLGELYQPVDEVLNWPSTHNMSRPKLRM